MDKKDFLSSENRELRHISKNMMYDKCQISHSIKNRTINLLPFWGSLSFGELGLEYNL